MNEVYVVEEHIPYEGMSEYWVYSTVEKAKQKLRDIAAEYGDTYAYYITVKQIDEEK